MTQKNMCDSFDPSSVKIRMGRSTVPLKVYSMAMEERENDCHYSEDGKGEKKKEEEITSSLLDDLHHHAEVLDGGTIPLSQRRQCQSDKAPLMLEIIRTMCGQEATIYHQPVSYFADIARSSPPSSKHKRKKYPETMDSWRSSLVQWMYQVVDFSHLRRETVGVAVYFLDVAIDEIILSSSVQGKNSTANQMSRRCLEECKVSFQLATATALQLAIKTHDCKIIKLQDLAILGRNVFTERDIVRMELQIIQACTWHLHPPSVYCYLHQYQAILVEILKTSDPPKSKIEDTVSTTHKLLNIITEIILPQSQYKNYPPSIVGYAIFLLGLASLSPSAVSCNERQLVSQEVSRALRLLPQKNGTRRRRDEDLLQETTQEQNQQFLLLRVLREVQASCQSCSQLVCADLLKEMVVIGGHQPFNPLWVAMSDDYNVMPSPAGKSYQSPPPSCLSSTILKSAGDLESPVAVVDAYYSSHHTCNTIPTP